MSGTAWLRLASLPRQERPAAVPGWDEEADPLLRAIREQAERVRRQAATLRALPLPVTWEELLAPRNGHGEDGDEAGEESG